ncbi:MAG: hypothetical protein J6B63_00050 [Treponema sp.]|nr:hypothetical protein [Treponema sp.]MBQ7881668.1 hypothetical protein [Treponema sp.]
MRDFFNYFFLFSVIAIFIWLISFLYKINLKKNKESYVKENLKTQKKEDGSVDFVRCPLCNTPLAKNEDMASKVFRPMNVPDQRMNILGCPHCYPQLESGVKRICPICSKEVPLDGYLISRLFNKTQNKKHVIVTGCSLCYGPKKTK